MVREKYFILQYQGKVRKFSFESGKIKTIIFNTDELIQMKDGRNIWDHCDLNNIFINNNSCLFEWFLKVAKNSVSLLYFENSFSEAAIIS